MNQNIEKPALLVIDMVKDNFIESLHLPITPFARAAINPLNKMIEVFRNQRWPVVFSTDAFHEKLIEVGTDNSDEFQTLKQRVSFVIGLCKHTPVEFQPGQFAVQIKLGRIQLHVT